MEHQCSGAIPHALMYAMACNEELLLFHLTEKLKGFYAQWASDEAPKA
jgi:hypothetical protein